jgi:hypothetical protein
MIDSTVNCGPPVSPAIGHTEQASARRTEEIKILDSHVLKKG